MNKFYKNKQDIINWLDEYEITSYTLITDEKYGFVIDVSDDVELEGKDLNFIPVKFRKVSRNFSCHNNQLTSLEFCPSLVVGRFDCSYNKLISLKFGSKDVSRSFDCSRNKLKSLEFCPTNVEFCPQSVLGNFICSNNKLTSLEFCPVSVRGGFHCDQNSQLGKLQKVTNFKEIYLKHREFLIEKFSHSLTSNLNIIASNKKSVKI